MAPHPFEFLSEIRMGQNIGKMHIEELAKRPSDHIGDHVINIVEAKLGHQLDVFNQKGDRTAGDQRPFRHVTAEKVKDIRQKITHRHKQDNIQIDLIDVFDLVDPHMFQSGCQTIGKDGIDEAQDTEIDLYRIGQ